MKIANKNKIYVVEDAAPAIGAKFKNKLVGTLVWLQHLVFKVLN